MKLLVAEDDIVSRKVLESLLSKWGHEVVSVEDGRAAWDVLCGEQAPRLCVLDWMMPEFDGLEVCRRLRAGESSRSTYVILLTARDRKEDIVQGLEAGADDYLTKPFDKRELRARVGVGERVIRLQEELNARVRELEEAVAHVRTLQGLLPICMHCHKIRDSEDCWEHLEQYIAEHSDAQFSHGICPDCLKEHYPELQE